jgi:SAM-dependent methyltransferase
MFRLLKSAAKRSFGRSRAAKAAASDPLRFDLEAFRRREVFRDNYRLIADALHKTIDFQSTLDLGCANGFLMQEFLTQNKSVLGVELSADVINVLPPTLSDYVIVGDATKVGELGRFDLVCCVEVAEHVPPEASASLVATIASNASKWVYFTAAGPCQPGHGHINCRQQFYWINEFRKHGISIAWEETERFLSLISGIRPAVWLEWNSLLFRVN